MRKLREDLLKIPLESLVNRRLHPKGLQALPYLATETRNADLRARVVQIATDNFDALSWSTLARLLPYLYTVKKLRRAAHRRARKEPPTPPQPPWLTAHWRASLGKTQPDSELAIVGLAEQPILARLLADLGVPTGSPLATRVLEIAVGQLTDANLAEQPYTETLRFIEHSGAAVHMRHHLLNRILELYLPTVGSRQALEKQPAMLELLALAHRTHHGWPDESPQLWSKRSERAIEVAGWGAQLMPTGAPPRPDPA